MTGKIPKPPAPPKFGRGALRSLARAELEDEAVYRNYVLEGENLAGLNLHAVTFEGCVLREVDLSGVHWRQIRFQDVRFEDCQLSGATFEECGLERVEVVAGRLLGSRWPAVRLRQVSFRRVSAPLSSWDKAEGKGVWWQDADLAEASFLEAKLPAAIFRGCKLHKTLFHGAKLEGADLRSCDLAGARLGLRELAGVTVEAAQLLDLAYLLGVKVESLDA